MNENQKNIETCLAEDILAEVANVPTDQQFRSLANESLDPLKQQAVEQAGSDAYEQVVQSHQPYTFTSTIVQMKSNLILLLRRLWRFPFGTGTLRSLADADIPRSLADMWSHYITRLSGNAEYGIPSRLDQLTALPSAPLLVADRKISNGGAENDGIVDGVSLAHILGHRSMVTKIDDDNSGWVCDSVMPNFPNLGDATLRMGSITAANALNNLGATGKVTMPELTSITSGSSQYNDPMPSSATEIEAKNLKTSDAIFCQRDIMARRIDLSGLKSLNGRSFYDFTNAETCPLEELRVPDLTSYDTWSFLLDYPSGCCTPNLILLEIGSNVSFSLVNWNPTNALDPTGTDLIEEGSTAQNNLQQFLQNFRDYIAERLATFPEGTTNKTLTLSAAVYSAIWDNNGDPLPTTICQEIDTIIVDTKHWRPNKAS